LAQVNVLVNVNKIILINNMVSDDPAVLCAAVDALEKVERPFSRENPKSQTPRRPSLEWNTREETIQRRGSGFSENRNLEYSRDNTLKYTNREFRFMNEKSYGNRNSSDHDNDSIWSSCQVTKGFYVDLTPPAKEPFEPKPIVYKCNDLPRAKERQKMIPWYKDNPKSSKRVGNVVVDGVPQEGTYEQRSKGVYNHDGGLFSEYCVPCGSPGERPTCIEARKILSVQEREFAKIRTIGYQRKENSLIRKNEEHQVKTTQKPSVPKFPRPKQKEGTIGSQPNPTSVPLPKAPQKKKAKPKSNSAPAGLSSKK